MKTTSWIGVTVLLAQLAACTVPKEEAREIRLLDLHNRSAVGPYFAYDTAGVPILCWTEKGAADSTYRLAFSSYDPVSGSFGQPRVVTGSEGISTSAESMGKIAFKDDGTIVAVFAKPFANEKNPFAGAIYYSISKDQGTSWSPARFLHTDTAHHYGRQFFDLATLGNGEVGAVWLDGRDSTIEGSTLFFAATIPDGGFGSETVVHRGTCECCRTDLLVDDAGHLHVAYRSLMYPAALVGDQVRDMAYVHSEDHGQSFSAEQPISADHWAIRACPHTGPSLAVAANRLHAVWFTAGGGTGLYYANSSPDTRRFGRRILLSATGTHPQLIAVDRDAVAVAYEERMQPEAVEAGHGDAHGHGNHSTPKAVDSRIQLQLIADGQPATAETITTGGANHHPVMARMDDRVLVAWVCEDGNRSGIAYTAKRWR